MVPHLLLANHVFFLETRGKQLLSRDHKQTSDFITWKYGKQNICKKKKGKHESKKINTFSDVGSPAHQKQELPKVRKKETSSRFILYSCTVEVDEKPEQMDIYASFLKTLEKKKTTQNFSNLHDIC